MADTKKKEDGERPGSERSCWQRFKDAVSLVPRGVTPPDWSILWLIFISLFSSAFTLTFLFPFLPEMILTFGYSEEEKGTYVGLVASSVFAGRAVGSFFWGWLSDLKGRRLVLLVTILFNGLFSFLFGFCHSLTFAMAVRFLAGLANGTVGVAKTVLYDVSDNTNQAFSMSIISIAWGSGLILGPTIGGYLALPATKYPTVFSPQGFFAHFPFILPSFCCLIVCGVILVIVFFKFQEPKLVINTEIQVVVQNGSVRKEAQTEGNSNAIQASHNGSVVGAEREGPKPAGSGCTTPTSRPLLDKLYTESTSSIPSQTPKARMSMETLHCESELSYYYAQLYSHSNQNSLTAGDKPESKSMHNLGPAAVPLINEEDDLPPVTRKRSYSHGHGTPLSIEIDQLNMKLDANHVMPKGRETVSEDAEIVVGDSERKGEKVDGCESDGLLKGQQCCESENRVEVIVDLTEGGKEPSRERWRSGLSSCWHSIRHSALVQLLRQRDVRLSVALYTVMSFAVIGYEDVFTIFASTAIEYDGLGFRTDEIGLALGVVSLPLIFIQIKVYPMLVSKFGIKKTFMITIFFLFIPVQLIPLTNLLAHDKVGLWVCLMGATLPLRVAANSCFAGSSLMINNSVTAKNAGKANGLGMTFTAIARTLAPTIGGVMFSWSLRMSRTVGPPLDVNLTFFFFGFILFISALQCVFLPDHLDHQKK